MISTENSNLGLETRYGHQWQTILALNFALSVYYSFSADKAHFQRLFHYFTALTTSSFVAPILAVKFHVTCTIKYKENILYRKIRIVVGKLRISQRYII